jgi:hypothetical protein
MEAGKARQIREVGVSMAADLGFFVERVTRIELALSAWEADVLPLNYTRARPSVQLRLGNMFLTGRPVWI